MFFHAELEIEARKASTDRILTWRFKRDGDQEQFIEEVIENAQSSLYLHHQTEDCTKKGKCSSCVAIIAYVDICSCINGFQYQ